MNKFTTGPWSVSDQCYGGLEDVLHGYPSVHDDKYAIAQMCDLEINEAYANAMLIACAPEMYEMLEEIIDSLGNEHSLPIHVIDNVTALLAKARGES